MASSAHNNHQSQRNQQQQQQHGTHQHHNNQNTSSAMMHHHPSSSTSTSLNQKLIIGSKERKDGAVEYGLSDQLDEALFLYLNTQQQYEHHQKLPQEHHHHHHSTLDDLQQQITHDGGIRPPTLNIFPSQPMHINPSTAKKQVNKTSQNDPRGLVTEASGCNSTSKMLSPEPISMDILANSALIFSTISNHDINQEERTTSGRRGTDRQILTRSQIRDAKTLRRLAQNREAARKSRLRKKAYIQQLESSRVKLTQIEQEIHRARTQGMCLNSVGGLLVPYGINNNYPTDGAIFDMEYCRWLEEQNRRISELKVAMEDENLGENELQFYIDNCVTHFDEIMNIRSVITRTDVFHLISGTWKSPAERCFMWIGGFRPSQIIKIVMNKVDQGLTDQQSDGICELHRSTKTAEDALSQSLEVLNQSLSETITYDSLTSSSYDMTNYMNQMAIAASKLSALEGFVRQADSLRHQTVHRLHRVLTTRQVAIGLLMIAEYFNRLRALSSLWLARPLRGDS